MFMLYLDDVLIEPPW